jgi:hypothetical protein
VSGRAADLEKDGRRSTTPTAFVRLGRVVARSSKRGEFMAIVHIVTLTVYLRGKIVLFAPGRSRFD